MSQVDCIICDIDGTVANLSHRLHLVDAKNYKDFYGQMGKDTPLAANVRIIRELARRFTLIFVSGRPVEYDVATNEWLSMHVMPGIDSPIGDGDGPAYRALYMRATGDYRADYIVKRELLDEIRADGFNPILVIDDRPRVIQMWREQGLTCWDVGGWDNWRGRRKYSFIPMPKDLSPLTIMVGPSGAGKSTYAEINFEREWVIESDAVRKEFGGYSPQQNAQVFSYVHDWATARLLNGLPVVIDATHVYRRDRLASVGLVAPDIPVTYVVVDRPMQDKRRDGGWRNALDFDLIGKHAEVFASNLKDILKGDGLPNVRVIDTRT